jgi:hypothetical protein
MAEFGVTWGQVNWNDPDVVPSWPVATVVRWIMSRLSPVMSSMAMFFQAVVELESPDQVVVQLEPASKMSPGAGVRGLTSARTTSGATRARRATKVCVANISFFSFKEN